MADEPSFPEEFADADNADSDEIAELNQRISDLEEGNSKIVRENKEYKRRVEELKASVEKLSSENADLKNQMESAQSDLEGEVSRLRHDLATAMSDLSELKSELEGMKGKEKEKDVKLEAAEREKALLVVELDARDKQIQVFKKNVEELEVVAGNGKGSETDKNGLQMMMEKMKAEISILQSCLDEKESVIRELNCRGINSDDGGKRGSIGGVRQRDWMLVGGTAIATAAVMGCYIHAARKH
ncbi:peroxisomal and mitochondrial division factor 1-like [Salvia miltiorrhiza]|uniref:peroxisomal and mitochondrial division factor 1-like n=1 Tax=Salvia miltiorrhiza TaxID=226208 RepID=UPI0025AD935D|nr:peroxisomal and mitochondrial division factor 1-like [Salvia miltiorrhiza]XP_057796137.1 peroxisomal and mitochondrial division factor 1-like [Salvia miltiorrhiza]